MNEIKLDANEVLEKSLDRAIQRLDSMRNRIKRKRDFDPDSLAQHLNIIALYVQNAQLAHKTIK